MGESTKKRFQMASTKQNFLRNSRDTCASQYVRGIAKERKCNL